MASALPTFFAHTSTWIRCALMIWYEPQPSTAELASGAVNVPELAGEPPELGEELLDFAAGLLALLEPVAGLVEPAAAGLLALTEPLPELAGAAGEPPPTAEAGGWLSEIAWVPDPDEHACKVQRPTTATDPIRIEVRRNMNRYPSVNPTKGTHRLNVVLQQLAQPLHVPQSAGITS
jgi:hypothetical protein